MNSVYNFSEATLHKGILSALPRDISFDAGQVEIIRMIGKNRRTDR